ncbi:hypothetical protein SGLAM104S_08811 [Streptomyces glaucescens]
MASAPTRWCRWCVPVRAAHRARSAAAPKTTAYPAQAHGGGAKTAAGTAMAAMPNPDQRLAARGPALLLDAAAHPQQAVRAGRRAQRDQQPSGRSRSVHTRLPARRSVEECPALGGAHASARRYAGWHAERAARRIIYSRVKHLLRFRPMSSAPPSPTTSRPRRLPFAAALRLNRPSEIGSRVPSGVRRAEGALRRHPPRTALQRGPHLRQLRGPVRPAEPRPGPRSSRAGPRRAPGPGWCAWHPACSARTARNAAPPRRP